MRPFGSSGRKYTSLADVLDAVAAGELALSARARVRHDDGVGDATLGEVVRNVAHASTVQLLDAELDSLSDVTGLRLA